jgi:hypothetical protein
MPRSLACWKAHEQHFSYVAFIAQQVLGIVGSQMEVKRIFNIVNICTNLRHSQLGTDNFEKLIIIYKNLHSGAHVGSSPSMDKDEHVGGLPSMEKFMEMKENLMDENEDVIA